MFGPSPTGHIVFAIGFADADYSELVSMASQPVDRHVFFVDDLDAFQKIEEKLITFVCEAASASEPPASCLLSPSSLHQHATQGVTVPSSTCIISSFHCFVISSFIWKCHDSTIV